MTTEPITLDTLPALDELTHDGLNNIAVALGIFGQPGYGGTKADKYQAIVDFLTPDPESEEEVVFVEDLSPRHVNNGAFSFSIDDRGVARLAIADWVGPAPLEFPAADLPRLREILG